jgi:DNA-binding NarL/FixJ family response regulator
LEERQTLIRVVIADDHPHVRSALRHVLELEADFDVVAEAGDGVQAVDEVVRNRPDLVILDYQMPQLDGLQVARELAEQAPGTTMVMLTSEENPDVKSAAENAGVARYLLKSGRSDELLSTLRAAALGRGEPLSVVVQSRPEQQNRPPRIA